MHVKIIQRKNYYINKTIIYTWTIAQKEIYMENIIRGRSKAPAIEPIEPSKNYPPLLQDYT